MNIIYLKDKRVIIPGQHGKRGRTKLEGTVETGPQTQFSQFSLVLWFGGMYLRLKGADGASYAFRNKLEKVFS